MAQAIAYLAFKGNCTEALSYYERVLGLGANVQFVMTGGDSPMADQIPPEQRGQVIHARLGFNDGSLLYAGDAPAHMPFDGMKGVSIAMNYPSTAEAERAFEALAEGGKVTMPLGPTFWAKIFGMVTDRFGTHWAINGELLGKFAV